MIQQSEPPISRVALRISEAAQALGVSRSALYVLLSSRKLPSVKVGGTRVVLVADLHAFLARNRVEAP